MDTSSYVGISAQNALQRRMTTIANNVANAGTVGFRAEGVHFSSLVSPTRPFRTTFATLGAQHVDTRSGGLVKTDNALDVAIEGAAFMAIDTPAGVAYTRDGRMQMLATGELVSLTGHPILDVSGGPLTLDPTGGPAQIARDGMIRQNGRAVGAVGLFQLDFTKPYSRYENASFIPKVPPEPIVEFTEDGVLQGFVEQSNVNPIVEMTNLIKVSRAFEAVASSLERRDSSLRDAIQTLGAKS